MCVIRTGKEGETGLIEIQNVSYAYEDAAAKALALAWDREWVTPLPSPIT
mgnify:CR=1 FL=1